MSYHIREVQKLDESGRLISREFFIVDDAGVVYEKTFTTIEQAMGALKLLLAKDDEPDPPPVKNKYSQVRRM